MYAQQGQQSQSPHPAQPQWEGAPPHTQPYRHPSGSFTAATPSQQQPGQYPQQPSSSQQPMNIRPDRPEMAAIHPNYSQHPPQQPMYLPSPSAFYGPHHDYRAPPQASGSQSAPRQRTAIACKYCRRRKIRCSGFENSEDGRCTNCNRFNQECIFTPVSAQTQAFVPAQAVYGGRRPPPGQPLYGSYGQPLSRNEAYPQAPGYALPHPGQPYPPQGPPYGQYMPQPPYNMHSPSHRPGEEGHPPSLPPPGPGEPRRDGGHSSYAYPDPHAYPNGVPSPASAGPPYHGMPQQGYYGGPPQPRRESPGAYPGYEQPTGSTSPHGQHGYYPQPGAMQHASVPSQSNGHTPPHTGPGNQESKNGMSISNMVSGDAGSGERTAADSDMISTLNRTSRR